MVRGASPDREAQGVGCAVDHLGPRANEASNQADPELVDAPVDVQTGKRRDTCSTNHYSRPIETRVQHARIRIGALDGDQLGPQPNGNAYPRVRSVRSIANEPRRQLLAKGVQLSPGDVFAQPNQQSATLKGTRSRVIGGNEVTRFPRARERSTAVPVNRHLPY